MPHDACISEDVDPRRAIVAALVDKLPAMVAYWDAGLRCRFANRAYERWFGVTAEAMIGRHMEEFLGPLFALNRPYIERALRGEIQEFEREIPDPAGGAPRFGQAHYVPDVVAGKVLGFSVLVVDITRRARAEAALRTMERQLQAMERLDAMTTLASGIAHEINNPLAAVLSNVELSLEAIERRSLDPTALRSALEDAREGAKRIDHIVQSMKLLARGDVTKEESVDVNRTLEQSIVLSAAAGKYRARLVRDMRGDPYVRGNASQLAQVFVNLLLNAVQSFPERAVDQNEVRVSTREEANRVIVEVRDNGCGIRENLLPRIFEPFFTTKGPGGGMGLGLSISRGIVGAFGGTLTASSEAGAGSCFRVELPLVTDADLGEIAVPRRHASVAPALARRARPRLLVVDDEVALGNVMKLILGPHYDVDVDVVGAGAEAVTRLLGAPEDHYDLVLCDLMMPNVSGEEVYAATTRDRPALAGRFVFMTGGAFTTDGRRFLEHVGTPVLEKPFDIAAVR